MFQIKVCSKNIQHVNLMEVTNPSGGASLGEGSNPLQGCQGVRGTVQDF